jgi:hypothetical protein
MKEYTDFEVHCCGSLILKALLSHLVTRRRGGLFRSLSMP